MYDEGFADLPEVGTPAYRPDVHHAWHLYVIQLKLNRLRISRNEFIEALKEENKIRAAHERIRLERSANAANNISFVFEFHYCRITPSRFT